MATILVVEDSEVDRRLIQGLLGSQPDWSVAFAPNGVEALACLKKGIPDVVVTDLQMPEMDGLELVTNIRLQYPQVPVVLITAKGSEELAVEALNQGASSYVPKSELAASLCETIDELLGLAGVEETYARLLACQQKIELNYSLDNHPGLIDALIQLVQQMMTGMKLSDDTGRYRVGVALREALMNAVFRGNFELDADVLPHSRPTSSKDMDIVERRRIDLPYANRKIHVGVTIVPDKAVFVIRDEGPGFDPAPFIVDNAASASGALTGKGGRGLVLIQSFANEVSFNAKGNEITLVFRPA